MTTNSPRKPRIALMGEFSAGKSTLSNLLLGARPLPEKVTATQLPPVWLSYGSEPAYREGLDGQHYPVDLNNLEDIPLGETRLVRIFMECDLLGVCDLIDMPGISDPNMASEVWEGVIPLADGVLWCTHATQAWRQSEAAVWDSLPDRLRERSLLLITRFDKLLNDKDRVRVLKRVGSETQGKFAGFYPISLTRAIAAGDDHDKWIASGAEAFTEALVDMIQSLSGDVLSEPESAAPELPVTAAAEIAAAEPAPQEAKADDVALNLDALFAEQDPEPMPELSVDDTVPEVEPTPEPVAPQAATAEAEVQNILAEKIQDEIVFEADNAPVVLPRRVKVDPSRTPRPSRSASNIKADILQSPDTPRRNDGSNADLAGLRDVLSNDTSKSA